MFLLTKIYMYAQPLEENDKEGLLDTAHFRHTNVNLGLVEGLITFVFGS